MAEFARLVPGYEVFCVSWEIFLLLSPRPNNYFLALLRFVSSVFLVHRIQNAHRQVSFYGYLRLFCVFTLTTSGSLLLKLSVFCFFRNSWIAGRNCFARASIGATIVPQSQITTQSMADGLTKKGACVITGKWLKWKSRKNTGESPKRQLARP